MKTCQHEYVFTRSNTRIPHICKICGEARGWPSDDKIATLIWDKMTTCNDIQVDRCTLTRKEFAELGPLLIFGFNGEG